MATGDGFLLAAFAAYCSLKSSTAKVRLTKFRAQRIINATNEYKEKSTVIGHPSPAAEAYNSKKPSNL